MSSSSNFEGYIYGTMAYFRYTHDNRNATINTEDYNFKLNLLIINN